MVPLIDVVIIISRAHQSLGLQSSCTINSPDIGTLISEAKKQFKKDRVEDVMHYIDSTNNTIIVFRHHRCTPPIVRQ